MNNSMAQVVKEKFSISCLNHWDSRVLKIYEYHLSFQKKLRFKKNYSLFTNNEKQSLYYGQSHDPDFATN